MGAPARLSPLKLVYYISRNMKRGTTNEDKKRNISSTDEGIARPQARASQLYHTTWPQRHPGSSTELTSLDFASCHASDR